MTVLKGFSNTLGMAYIQVLSGHKNDLNRRCLAMGTYAMKLMMMQEPVQNYTVTVTVSISYFYHI